MDRETDEDECEEVKEILKDVKCRVCGKNAHSSTRNSNNGQDFCTCESSSSQSTAISTNWNPVTGEDSRPCKNDNAGCTELIVSTNSDHETLCGYRNTHCKDENCMKPILVKDLLLHIHNNHELVPGESLVLTWPIPEEHRRIVFPLYAFESIVWEFITFKNNAISIAFFHESPNRFTQRLFAVLSVKVHDVQFADTVRVLNYGDDPGSEQFNLLYSKVQLYRSMRSAYGCMAVDRDTTVRQELRIVENIS